jgi:FkbM family methyltransferase
MNKKGMLNRLLRLRIPFSRHDRYARLGRSKRYGIGHFYEEIIEASYSELCCGGDLVVDGGVHHGRHSLPMAKVVGRNGLILGLEANPAVANAFSLRLKEQAIGNINVVAQALSDRVGETSFVVVQADDGWSGIRERKGLTTAMRRSVVLQRVPCTTLDHCVAQLASGRPVRFIKLDLEGGEFHALKGALWVLKRQKPFIVFENGRESSASVYGYTKDEWFQLFDAVGYEVFDLFGRPFTRHHWDAAGIPWYFIGVAADQKEDLRFVRKKLPQLIERIFQQSIRPLDPYERLACRWGWP